MNIYKVIQQAITNTGANVSLFLQEKSRAENETQNHEGAVITIDNKFTANLELLKNTQIKNSTRYVVTFLDRDEWDTKDYDEANIGTFQIIENMTILANSIFSNIKYSQELYFPTTANLTWAVSTIWRENANTMSGVSCIITLPFIDSKVCTY